MQSGSGLRPLMVCDSMDDHPPAIDVAALLAHRAWLRRLVAGLVRDRDDRDDVKQDTWLHALRTSRPVRDARALLAAASRGLALNRVRGAARRRRRESAVAATERQDADPAAIVARVGLERRVIGHLLALPEPCRGTLLARFFEDRSCEEIAARRGVPAATVRSQVQRALAALRERIDADGEARGWMAIGAPLG